MHGLRSFSGPGELSPLISMDFAVLLPHQPGPRMAVQTGIRLALKIRELRCSELSYAPAHAHQAGRGFVIRSEEHTSELQSLMRISYAVFCLKTKNIVHKLAVLSR